MSDHDAIVIGAGHNGLTAAAVMARAGLDVVCLEKNQFVGGMASTTELIRGYRFELAGSVQFPMPPELYDDLGFAACEMFEPEVMSSSIGVGGKPPMLFHTDPNKLVEHLTETLGLDAVLGMAEVMAWADAPARALGRFEVRRPPKTLDEMFACASNETEREAIRTMLFGSVMDVVDRFLPDPERHAQMRALLAFLSVNSTFRGPYSAGSATCLAFALAGPTGQSMVMSKVAGGIGAMSDHVLGLFERSGGLLRRHAKAEEILVDDGRVRGVRLVDGEVITAPIVVSNLDPTLTFTGLLDQAALPAAFGSRVGAIDHRAAYYQVHFALSGLPEYVGPYEVLNEGTLRGTVTMFGTAEEMQRSYEQCVRGVVPERPPFSIGTPSIHDPALAPTGKHAASAFAFYFPVTTGREDQTKLRDEMAQRIVAQITEVAPDFPDLIERQLNYPAYTYEMMFGCTGGDFTHGLLHPELMGPFRPGPRGWADNPIPIEGLYLCGAGCHGGPGVTFIPGYNAGYAVLDALGIEAGGAAAGGPPAAVAARS
jgi:phytoene dehydrogenase-like protein